MPTLFVTSREGAEMTVEAETGRSLMETIRDGAFDELLALCGGCCSCATCHVYVDPSATGLPPIGSDEADLLGGSPHRQAGSRLACQIPIRPELDGLRVRIAPED